MSATQPQRIIEGRAVLLRKRAKRWQDTDLILWFCEVLKKQHVWFMIFSQQPGASSLDSHAAFQSKKQSRLRNKLLQQAHV